MRLVLASANPGKLKELSALLAPLGYDLVPQSELAIEPIAETGTTFIENALLKARHAAREARCAALADDSGIEVDALEGRPGVYSARYAGENASDAANLEKMLRELQGMAPEKRGACYRCVIALVRDAEDSQPLIAKGTWVGSVLAAPRGGGGFGYDPIFLPAGFTRSAAELAAAEKNSISHRAKALRALVRQLSNL